MKGGANFLEGGGKVGGFTFLQKLVGEALNEGGKKITYALSAPHLYLKLIKTKQ